MRTLRQYLLDVSKMKNITLYFDIETFQYNEKKGKDIPSEYKNMVFALGVSWEDCGIIEYELFPNFRYFFDVIIETYQPLRKRPNIKLNAHNSNKYDNHFLRKELMTFYPHMRIENQFLLSATTEESNENSLKMKDLNTEDKKGIVLEKRIKSSINLEMVFFIYGIKFETVDNWVKTNSSIKMLGKKLKRLGVVTDDELKTDFDYLKYNRDEDMTSEEARDYALDIFNNLESDQKKYIRNDVILLAKSVYYYSQLFKGFDYTKRTFTSNILESYNTNNMTSFQLLNKIGEGKDKQEIRYTDYQFSNQNFYDYLKPFYRGGLNFYNQFYIGKVINDGVFSMDINSSYPYAMHNFKIPTFIKDYEEYETPQEVDIIYSDDEYSLFQLSKETFDHYIINQIDSVILKQILVKYYSTNEFININTYTFRMIENVTGLHFDRIPAYSRVTFECDYFGSRDQIEEFYYIKTQGKQEKKIIFNSPYDIQLTDEKNTERFSSEEIDNSKVNLNGLYGIPALRPYFNLFRLQDGEYHNIENGHKNVERNIVFSIFVTSVSLWNLLDPLKYLTQEEIDENFIYCDTDSLYMKKKIQHKLSDDLFHPFHLGKWDLEHNHMTKFYVLNHKKYAYLDEENNIKVKSGGIPHDSFNTDMSFEEFISTQFSDGVKIKTLKSIYNRDMTISIYPSITELEIGKGYRVHASGMMYDKLKEKMFDNIRKSGEHETAEDVLYIESFLGTFSMSELFPFTHEVKKKEPLVFLEIKQERFKKIIKG